MNAVVSLLCAYKMVKLKLLGSTWQKISNLVLNAIQLSVFFFEASLLDNSFLIEKF